MTTTEAARIIGCTPQAVWQAIKAGRLQAKKIKSNNRFPYRYDIRLRDVEAYRDRPRGRGMPRKGSK